MASSFEEEYSKLEEKFRKKVEKDNVVAGNENIIYLPPFTMFPDEYNGKVDYILIGMEPSLGRWAKTQKQAQYKISHGFVDYITSFEDFILHFAIRQYLCKNGETYCLTNLSKGAMLVKSAGTNRNKRYIEWYPLLFEEIELLAKDTTKIFSIGYSHVQSFLVDNKFSEITGYEPHPIMHYSPLAAKHRNKFEILQSVKTQDILDTAEYVFKGKNIDPNLAAEILKRLRNRTLTESQKKLLFHYKTEFENIKNCFYNEIDKLGG
jgi:hypothetical protein